VGTDGAVMRALAMVSVSAVLFGVSARFLARPRSVPAVRPELVRAGVVR
jgi:hypothetical protein